ncbi:hypothetical protein ACSBR1_003366 [Camellia fascicularis]
MSVDLVASNTHGNLDEQIAQLMQCKPLSEPEEYGSSKAAMKLSEFVRCPVKVQRCAGRVVQTELLVQVDQRDVVPGDIVIFEPDDLFPGDVRLPTSPGIYLICIK